MSAAVADKTEPYTISNPPTLDALQAKRKRMAADELPDIDTLIDLVRIARWLSALVGAIFFEQLQVTREQRRRHITINDSYYYKPSIRFHCPHA